jgi:3-hydroxybutyryl-CoA dehydratase
VLEAAIHRPFESLELGQRDTLDWRVERQDIDRFAALSGDRNPLHVDAEFARARGFPDVVAHGYLLGAKVSALVGMLLPGRDCLILETTMAYPKPVHPGDLVRVAGEVDMLSPEQRILRVKIRAHRIGAGPDVLVGRGSVLCRNQ